MSDAPLDNLTIRTQRKRAYLRFLQQWRREVMLLRQHRMGEMGVLIGDPTCLYNARSSRLRCAVNPSGPCEGCNHYEPIATNRGNTRLP